MEDQQCVIPKFGADHENINTFPQPGKELSSDLKETVHVKFNNNLEMGDSYTESPENLFCSGYKTKYSHSPTDQDVASPVKSTVSINLSDEEWSSSELFCSGNGKEKTKSKSGPHGEIKTNDEKEYISSVSSNELFGSDSGKHKAIDTESRTTFYDDCKKEMKEKTESEVFNCDDKSEKCNKLQSVYVIDQQTNDCNKTRDDSDTAIKETKKSWSLSVQSADLFGAGNENFQSKEFSIDLHEDQRPEEDTEFSFVENEVESNSAEAVVRPPKPAPRNLLNIKREPVKVESTNDDSESEAPIPAPRNVVNVNTEPVVTPEPEIETLWNKSAPTQNQQWASNDYGHPMFQNFAPYFTMPVDAQNLPSQENMNANIMRIPMNPMYHMLYGSTGMLPNVTPDGMGQTRNQQMPSGMAAPPVVYVPVYVHGPLPPNPAVKTDRHLDDRSVPSNVDDNRNPSDGSQSGFYSYQKDTTSERQGESTDHKEPYIYDSPYKTVSSTAADLQTACSEGVIKSRSAKRNKSYDFAESNVEPYADGKSAHYNVFSHKAM